LWLTSYDNGDQKAKEVYVNLSYVNFGVTLVLFFVMGVLADKLSPKVLIPLGFTMRGVTLMCLYFIKDPVSY